MGYTRSLARTLVLVLLLLSPYNTVLAAAQDSGGTELVNLLLPLKADYVGLTGAGMDSLRVAACIGGRLVEGAVHILPREYSRVFLATKNTSVTTPFYGDKRLRGDDIIVFEVPYPLPATASGYCGWGVYPVLGLERRVVVLVEPGAKLILLGGNVDFYTVERSLILYVFYSADEDYVPGMKPSFKLFTMLGEALGVTGSLQGLRRALSSHVDEAGAYTRLLGVEEYEGAMSVRGFYWFSFQLNPQGRSILGDYYARRVYLGFNVEFTGVHLIAGAPEGGDSCVRLVVEAYTLHGDEPFYRIERSYWIRRGGIAYIDAYLGPEMNTSDKPLQVLVKLEKCGGLAPIVHHVSLEAAKKLGERVAWREHKGLKILSHAIASHRPEQSKLSKMLEAREPTGLVLGPGSERVAMPFNSFNGVYYGDNSSRLYVSVLLENNCSTEYKGEIKVAANGFTVAERGLSTTGGAYAYTELLIPLSKLLGFMEYAGGGLLTISINPMPGCVKAYVDAYAEYSYLPETWHPDSISWDIDSFPLTRILLYQVEEHVAPCRTSIVVGHWFFVGVHEVDYYAVLVEEATMPGQEARMASLEIRVPKLTRSQKIKASVLVEVEGGVSPSEGLVKAVEKLNNIVHGFFSLVLTIVEYITRVPRVVLGTVFVSESVISVAETAVRGYALDARIVETSSGEYYVVRGGWAGWAQRPARLRLSVHLLQHAMPGNHTIEVSAVVGGLKLKNISTILTVDPLLRGVVYEPSSLGGELFDYRMWGFWFNPLDPGRRN